MPKYAKYDHVGDEYIDHTPGSDIDAAEPILVGPNFWGVSSLDIPANTLGTLRVSGVFRGLKTNASDTFSAGDLVDFTPSQGFASGNTWRVRADSPSGQTYVLVEVNPPGGGGSGTVVDEVIINNGALSGSTGNYEIGWDYANKVLYADNGAGTWEVCNIGDEVTLNAGALSGATGGFELGWDYTNKVLYADDGGGTWEEVYNSNQTLDAHVMVVDGLSEQKQDMTVVNDGGLQLDVEAVGGGDINYVIDGTVATLDCTTGSGAGGKARVALTAGSDANTPATNYVYVTEAGGVATLTSSTTMPAGAFAWVGKIVVPDATTWGTTGAYGFQRYTESYSNDSRGAISHQREKLRALGAVYISGCTSNTVVTPGSPDTVHVQVASGQIYQLHRQTWPTTNTGPYYYGNGTTIYDQIANLSSALAQADGTAITNNQRFNLVLWGAVNITSGECKLFVNLPTGIYSTDSAAAADSSNTADYSVPADLRSVAFMIARVAFRYQSSGGGTWTELGTYSLLGTPPGVRSGGSGAVATTEFDDSTFRVFDDADSTKQIAFEASSISTSTTRTITMADSDVDLGDHNLQVNSINNPLLHGAVGNGVTDDTAAVQACLTAGGTILIPRGYTFLTDLITASSDGTTIFGGGVLKSNSTTSHFKITADGVTVDGVEFDGNSSGATKGVFIENGAARCIIRNCYIHNYQGAGDTVDGVFVKWDTEGIKILNNYIYDISTTDNGPARGIRLVGQAGEGLNSAVVSGNTVDYIYPVADGDGIVVQTFDQRSNIVISNNTLTQCAKRAIKVQSPGVTVANNVIVMTNVGGGADPLEAVLVAASHVVAVGNQLTVTATDAAFKIGVTAANSGIVISQNTVEFVGAGSNCDGIELSAELSHSSFVGNSFRGGMRMAARMNANVSHFAFSANVCDSMSQHGIAFVGTTAEDIAVTGNSFTNVGTGYNPVNYSGGGTPANVRVSGNQYDGSGSKYLCHPNFAAADPTYVIYGTGTPEANFIAKVGHRFIRTDGGASTVLYVKESGSSTTGWAAK